ncbi:hypothetical protein M514_00988 [Trichuris suis]|uniref:Reverse transcriptase domain-containing protein n=1 Tax=Trichuris suis TaxID=68888 RepID=A0A085NLZ6_9BILA|nr:hypothetical protein M514_00988 [Trichuris suis]
MDVDGELRNVLVDTGCTKCIAHVSCCRKWRASRIGITTLGGKKFHCEGTGSASLQLPGRNPVEVEVIIAGTKPLGFDFILGVNGIAALGGVTVDGQRRVWFGSGGPTGCAVVDAEMRVDERDFTVSYNRDTRSWTASWKWSEGVEPGILRNTVEEYSPADGARPAYEEELQKWIDSGWLVPYDERKYGEPKGLIPLMAVVQRNNHKVRPMMDFRELNRHIETFTADSDVCAEKLREWRRQGANVSLIDLKKAYLQICVDQSLWPYQTVVFKRRRYCLTRLGFGLNVAPLIMKAVVNCVLSQDLEIHRGTSAYIDDILVNEDVVRASRVEHHLAQHGLTCKTHERVAEGARVLGLWVWGEHGRFSLEKGQRSRQRAAPAEPSIRVLFVRQASWSSPSLRLAEGGNGSNQEKSQ